MLDLSSRRVDDTKGDRFSNIFCCELVGVHEIDGGGDVELLMDGEHEQGEMGVRAKW